jgi:hypothetical protein
MQNDPDGQGVHSLSAVRLVALVYVPAGHGKVVGEDDPSGQK